MPSPTPVTIVLPADFLPEDALEVRARFPQATVEIDPEKTGYEIISETFRADIHDFLGQILLVRRRGGTPQ